MKSSNKTIPVLTATLFLSGCSVQSYWSKIENYFYSKYPSVTPDKICVDHHFHRANTVSDEISRHLSQDISYFYWYGSEESQKADNSFQLSGPYIFDEETDVIRIPAINNNDWAESAKWSLALRDLGIDSNREIVEASYDHFLGNEESSFDYSLMNLGKSPSLFYEILGSTDFRDEMFLIGDATYKTGIEKVPAIMVNRSYIVYPSDYNDPRDAWIVAGYLLNSPLSIPQKCL